MPRKKRMPAAKLTEAQLEAQLEAAADRLTRFAKDKGLIPGIYNYCDRWCERCPQTARCLNFKMEQARTKQSGRPAANDLKNREFWDELGESFALALHMVRRDAQRLGIDLDSPEAVAAVEAEQLSRRRRAAREGSGNISFPTDRPPARWQGGMVVQGAR